MTAEQPPSFLQTSASGTSAEDLRRVFYGMTNATSGVLGATDLQVTQNGTPNMSVNVATGQAWIPGTQSVYQGSYFVENRGTQNLTVAASDPTNGRIDLVVAEVRDSQYSGADNDWRLRVITGTPSGSPVSPAMPSNAILLASISVNAGITSVLNAHITDSRRFAHTREGIWRCTSTTRPASPQEGQAIYESDTDTVLVYNGSIWLPTNVVYLVTGSGWTAVASPSFNPVTGASLVLPPGKWLIEGFMMFGVLTTANRAVNLRLQNATDGTTIDSGFRNHGPNIDTNPSVDVIGTLNNTTPKTVRLEANVSAIDGFQNFQRAKLWARPVTAIF